MIAMEITQLSIKDILLVKPRIHEDKRGYLYETFNEATFNKLLKTHIHFVQDVHSYSKQHTLRGLHYQLPQKAQAKLVRVIKGEIFDVAIDLRKHSSSFGSWVGHILSAKNKLQMWIPEGFANGFLVLSEDAEVVYKVTEFYSPDYERSIFWRDESLKIDWPIKSEPIISDRDLLGTPFKDAEMYS
jgi:dTDP-4-dehydrorhamnose 3,5-epimerase